MQFEHNFVPVAESGFVEIVAGAESRVGDDGGDGGVKSKARMEDEDVGVGGID